MLVWTLQAPLKRLLASSQHTPLSLLPNLTARPYLRVPSPRIPDALGLDHERSSVGGKEGGPNRGSIFPHMRTLGHPDGKVLSRDCLSLIPCLRCWTRQSSVEYSVDPTIPICHQIFSEWRRIRACAAGLYGTHMLAIADAARSPDFLHWRSRRTPTRPY